MSSLGSLPDTAKPSKAPICPDQFAAWFDERGKGVLAHAHRPSHGAEKNRLDAGQARGQQDPGAAAEDYSDSQGQTSRYVRSCEGVGQMVVSTDHLRWVSGRFRRAAPAPGRNRHPALRQAGVACRDNTILRACCQVAAMQTCHNEPAEWIGHTCVFSW
jgi:hypothetical protein